MRTFVLTPSTALWPQLPLIIQSSVGTQSTGNRLITKSLSWVSVLISGFYGSSHYGTPYKRVPTLPVAFCLWSSPKCKRFRFYPQPSSPFLLHLSPILCTSTASLILRMSASLHLFPTLNSNLPNGHFYVHAILSTSSIKAEPLLPQTVLILQMSPPFSWSHGCKLCRYLHLPFQVPLPLSEQAIVNPSLQKLPNLFHLQCHSFLLITNNLYQHNSLFASSSSLYSGQPQAWPNHAILPITPFLLLNNSYG